MILAGSEIKKQVALQKICIVPFDKQLINPNSYNYRLGTSLYEVISAPIDVKEKTEFKKIQLDEEGYVLKPSTLYLAHTYEKIGSDHFVTSLIGRSSLGRLGLFLQATADLGQLGAKHCWTLELKVVQPLRIYPFMKIGQVSFWKVNSKKHTLYDGEYGEHSDPHVSKIYKEFKQ